MCYLLYNAVQKSCTLIIKRPFNLSKIKKNETKKTPKLGVDVWIKGGYMVTENGHQSV